MVKAWWLSKTKHVPLEDWVWDPCLTLCVINFLMEVPSEECTDALKHTVWRVLFYLYKPLHLHSFSNTFSDSTGTVFSKWGWIEEVQLHFCFPLERCLSVTPSRSVHLQVNIQGFWQDKVVCCDQKNKCVFTLMKRLQAPLYSCWWGDYRELVFLLMRRLQGACIPVDEETTRSL